MKGCGYKWVVIDMNFLLEEKALELSTMKCINEIENNSSTFLINFMEFSHINDNDYLLEASFEDFKNKVFDIIENIIEALKKFFKEVRVKVDSYIQQHSLNKKLDEMKEILAKKRSKAMNQKIDMFDVYKYKQFYTDFINKYVSEIKVGLNKDFKSEKEYEDWKTSMEKKLSEFNYKLTDEEQWKIRASINDAIKLSENEIKNRNTIIKKYETDTESYIRDIKKSYVNSSSKFSLKDDDIHIMGKKSSFIGFVCSKLALMVKTIYNILTKHTFACVTAVIVALIAL